MDCTGEITLPEGTEMVMPGDNVTITVELIYPVALNEMCIRDRTLRCLLWMVMKWYVVFGKRMDLFLSLIHI